MKSGTVMMNGGGGHLWSCIVTTDGAGAPVLTAGIATSPVGSPIGASSNVADVWITKGGAGIYTLNWKLPTFGPKLAGWNAQVNLTGDWTVRGALTQSSGTLALTFLTGGVATNVVSGSISLTMIFGTAGY